MDLSTEVEAVIEGTDDVPKSDYLRWAREGDLATRARVYRLTESAWARIQPEPSMSEQCAFMLEYLLECILIDPNPNDYLHSGFEAAYELAAWLKHLSTIPEARPVVLEVVSRLGTAYKEANPTAQNRIETGALEHALESPKLRPLFSSWAADPVLHEAHERALAWGRAHSEDDN